MGLPTDQRQTLTTREYPRVSMCESTLFTKLLVARHSPKNRCHAQDGEVLIVKPKMPFPSKDASHHFVSAKDGRTKSKYGWVREMAPFTLQDFISTYLLDRTLSEEEREHIRSMLTAAARIPVEKPATVDYVVRGVERRVTVLNVHRVFFYPKPEIQQP
jgi:hypothetical protein